VRKYLVLGVVILALLGVATTYVVRYQPTRHACTQISADSEGWQLNDMGYGPVDTSGIERAAQRMHDRAAHVGDVDVRTAGLALSSTLTGVAQASHRPHYIRSRAEQAAQDAALTRFHDAWTRLRGACGLPRVDDED
jgi:hypothetical protein